MIRCLTWPLLPLSVAFSGPGKEHGCHHGSSLRSKMGWSFSTLQRWVYLMQPLQENIKYPSWGSRDYNATMMENKIKNVMLSNGVRHETWKRGNILLGFQLSTLFRRELTLYSEYNIFQVCKDSQDFIRNVSHLQTQNYTWNPLTFLTVPKMIRIPYVTTELHG